MYTYKDSTTPAATANMESGGYLTTSFNNNPSLREGFFRPTAADSFTAAAADDVTVSSHHQGLLGAYQVDPHLTCLKLGKRHYFDHSADVAPYHELRRRCGFSTGGKKGSPADNNLGASSAAVARCQVDGCHAPLVSAKEYHRRHKVCEVHAKAAKVVVLGADQRFCQQCSRFHGVSEFDESKRSCRRRLAGHNERRRKSSRHDSGRALSLLSSRATNYNNAVISEYDLSSRSSAALRDLIAQHRATTSILSPHYHHHNNWLLSLHQNTANIIKAKEEAESCSELWNVTNSFNNLM